ncbi:RDD family protein [Sediminitomix flava]|uniref:RDD family protein n=1 Tax=Sediminitomix flava TaxID=379075 RepID=A0A316A2X5_SEDFL|nr:RDD family protein [Sediminitomix flava]PWJ44057.1 RDD family protein [Sediminitomix flava]
MKKKFDFSHYYISPKLENTHLGSFGRRSIAFLIDWSLILFAANFFEGFIFLGVIYLIYKNKWAEVGSFIKSELIKFVNRIDQRLGKRKFSTRLRRNFILYGQLYIYSIIGFTVFISLTLFAVLVYSFVTKDDQFILEFFNQEELTTPFTILHKVLSVVFSTFGALFYFTLFTWKWKGQTPGKRLLGLRVVKINGKHIKLWDSLERVSGYASSASTFFLGFLQYFWERNHMTTHDKICETIVVDSKSYDDESREFETLKQEVVVE